MTARRSSFQWRESFKWFTLFNFFAQVIALKDLRISVPEAVATGDTVTLSCFYDLENAALYSVRWYFENEEFYRYVPKEQPPSRVFVISGVPVDIQRSGEHSVIVHSVSRNHSGSYQCEVSADAPLFHTESSTATMLVADLPDSEPIISILGMAGTDNKRIVNNHETFKAHCASAPSYPPANFTWFVNGIRFPSTHNGLRDPGIGPYPSDLKETWSELIIQVDNHIISNSNRKLIVRCETNIFGLFRGTTETELYVLGDDFYGGKVSPTIDQRGNRGDPDNSALTGGVSSVHRKPFRTLGLKSFVKYLQVMTTSILVPVLFSRL